MKQVIYRCRKKKYNTTKKNKTSTEYIKRSTNVYKIRRHEKKKHHGEYLAGGSPRCRLEALLNLFAVGPVEGVAS